MNGFVAKKIPDECALNLGFAIIRNAVVTYARALDNLKRFEKAESEYEKEKKATFLFSKNECEEFFRGKWFIDLAENIGFNFSGEKIIKMVQKKPKKFYQAQEKGRKKHDH